MSGNPYFTKYGSCCLHTMYCEASLSQLERYTYGPIATRRGDNQQVNCNLSSSLTILLAPAVDMDGSNQTNASVPQTNPHICNILLGMAQKLSKSNYVHMQLHIYVHAYVTTCTYFLYTLYLAYVSVKFTTVCNVAGGVDYESGPYCVTFRKGDNTAQFCVNIIDDRFLELNKMFGLEINSISHAYCVTHKHLHTAYVAILDNECKYLI